MFSCSCLSREKEEDNFVALSGITNNSDLNKESKYNWKDYVFTIENKSLKVENIPLNMPIEIKDCKVFIYN